MILTIVLTGFVLALVAPLATRAMGARAGWGLAIVPAAIFFWLLAQMPTVTSGQTSLEHFAWVETLDVALAFRLDGLSLLFSLLISGIGALIFVYAQGYLNDDPGLGRFYAFLALFMGSMLGVVLADNILTMFVFWELTSISSFLLIGYKHEKEASRRSALQALLVTGSGGLALLAGLVLISVVAGTSTLGELTNATELIQASAAYPVIVVLVLLGAMTKSAQMPFHFWLPNAMEAPTPVSAYLHSATMVKAGIYLLARMTPILGGTALWGTSLLVIGGVTMLISAGLALLKTDLKQILAYSTISALGMLVFLLGLGNKLAFEAAMLFLIVHSMYKGALFMAAGAIDHETGTRDIRLLGGLRHAMPLVFVGVLLAAGSMTGFPPFLGFVGKELIYETTLDAPGNELWLTGLALLTNILTVGAALLVALKPFIGPRTETPRHPHRAPLTLWGGTALLGTLSLLFGLFPALLDSIISATATWMYHKPVEAHLALWHGFTPMLLLSVITLTLGYGAYALNARWLALGERVQTTAAFLPARLFWRSLNALEIMAHKLTLTLHNGKLRNYLLVIVLSTVVLGIIGFLSEPFGIDFSATVFSEQTDPRVFTLFELLFILIMPIGAFMAVMATAPLIAVAALGVIGFAMAVVYIMFAAPDLAMTQFAIETLAVLLFVLVLRKLPAFESHTELRQRIRDGLIASTVGVFITLLTLSMLAERHPLPLFESLLEKSVKAKGLNVVNVILVDIRGFDTLGEVTVLAVAAIGVYALLKFRRGGTDYFLTNLDLATQETFSKIRINSLILSATLRVVLPLLVMFSIFLFLRGHNEPGGGFIGGLSAAAAFSLYAIAEGMQKAFRSLRFHTRNFINWGLLIALSSGFLSFIFAPDKPFAFMRGVWMTQELPIIGKFGSPTVFDLGVELVVFGVTLTIIYALMEVLD